MCIGYCGGGCAGCWYLCLFREEQQSQHPQQQSAIPPHMHLTKHHRMDSAMILPRMIPTITGHLLRVVVSRVCSMYYLHALPTNMPLTCSCPMMIACPVCPWVPIHCPTSLSVSYVSTRTSLVCAVDTRVDAFVYSEVPLFTYFLLLPSKLLCRPATKKVRT